MRSRGFKPAAATWPDRLAYWLLGFAFGYFLAAVVAARSWGGIP